ncbi:hypothetical protein [Amycolatopsis sp. NPDC059021]|uniref:hypothetical protein n=1 Tax=Amycolatopsis sp. NPDC059021 TaxID=3346704 RepID=UPI00366E54AD
MQIFVLGFFLLGFLLQGEPPPRLGTRQRYTLGVVAAGPLAILIGSQAMPLPMVLLLESERARLAGNWPHILVLAASPVVAYGLVRLLSPPRLKKRHGIMILRAAGLLVVVVAAERLALGAEVPVLSVGGPIGVIALLVTASYLACFRTADQGYWPLPLVRDGVQNAAILALIGWWIVAVDGTLVPDPRSAPGMAPAVALTFWAVVAVDLTELAVGGWRLQRWLRHGPPERPGPPGVPNWPPAPGEVWSVLLTHDTGNYKDRPVLVLERTPTHANVLIMTSRDKSGSRFHQALDLADWRGVLDKAGYLSLEKTPVPFADFRLYRGDCTDRFWHRLLADSRIRDRRNSDSPAPGFAFRHRFASARNKHVGVNEGAQQPGRRRQGTRAGRR